MALLTARTRVILALALVVSAVVFASGWLLLAIASTHFQAARQALFAVALSGGALMLLAGVLLLRRLSGPEERARLTEAFDRMTASLKVQRDRLVAQEKLATVGRLAAGVAHEVGNPLAAVLGYAEMLLADEPEGASERRDMLERIRKETERIRHIVADLLDYSRPVAGAVEPVPLTEVVEGALGLLRPQARFRAVTVENQVPPELKAAASTSRMVQVLVNLLLNAADAMGGAGTITVGGRRLDGDSGLMLSVRDRGPGVPEADREKLFDPFFTTKEPGHGTGLGLAVSRSIAQAFGGDLLLARTDGPGATFVVRLPEWRG